MKNLKEKKEFSDRKLVGFSMEQMFDVVFDVEQYNKFIPFCKKSILISKTLNHQKAQLAIGFPPIQESYISYVTCVRPHFIQAISKEGKLFNHLETVWRFSPGLKSNEHSCIIDFYVSFEFKSLLHSKLAHIFFDQLVNQMENAFIIEAGKRYGKASIKCVKLSENLSNR